MTQNRVRLGRSHITRLIMCRRKGHLRMCPVPVSVGDLLNSTNDMIRYHCRPGVDLHFRRREEPSDKRLHRIDPTDPQESKCTRQLLSERSCPASFGQSFGIKSPGL